MPRTTQEQRADDRTSIKLMTGLLSDIPSANFDEEELEGLGDLIANKRLQKEEGALSE